MVHIRCTPLIGPKNIVAGDVFSTNPEPRFLVPSQASQTVPSVGDTGQKRDLESTTLITTLVDYLPSNTLIFRILSHWFARFRKVAIVPPTP